MTSNMLCLNPSKTEFILIGLREQLKKIPDASISLDLDSVSTHTFIANSPVRNLGVTFDQNLSLAFPITSPIFPVLASCTSVTSAESALCLTSKLHPQSLH